MPNHSNPPHSLYSGPTQFSKMESWSRTAYQSWLDQRYRCNNRRSPSFEYYGAKGVRVLYGSREFVGWWFEQLKTFSGSRPTVSRIDHGGHYEFGNIKLEDHIDNCVWDVIKRTGAPGTKCRVPVVVLDGATKERLMICASQVEAAKVTGAAHSNVNSICAGRGRAKTAKGFSFEYLSRQSHNGGLWPHH